ncbi:putative ribonuclease H-like domain-containing protein [Tanacetum coccineum]
MNYVPVVTGNQTNGIAGTKDNIIAGPNDSEEDSGMKPTKVDVNGASDKDGEDDQATRSEFERLLQQEKHTNNTNSFNTAGTPVSAAGLSFTNDDPSLPVNAAEASNAFEEHLFERFSPFKNAFTLPPVSNVTPMDDTRIFSNAYNDEDVGAEADLNNLETTMNVSPIPTTRIDKDHLKDQIIRDFNSSIQTRRMAKISDEHAMKVIQALEDPRWVEIMKEELLQFKLQKVWTLVDLPNGKRPIGTKWVFRNKKDERGIFVKNKARLVAHCYTQEEGIDYDEVFAHVARIEAIRLFLAYASFMGFIVYRMDVKSAFLYGTIEEEEYVDDIIFRSIKKSLCVEFEQMMHKRFQMSSIGELTFFLGLQVKQKDDGIFISQDKYVADILKKFDFVTVKTTSTPIETNKALLKDEEAEDVDVHLYRSMIGSLMYLTASRPDIMFAVCACARFQVTPKVSHLHAVKRIFRYLKGQPKLGLWYPRDSPFDLEAFSDSDYAGASLDRKSTTGAEYVAAANCCGQVLWIQNQMLDYGFNFMNTKIHIDNEGTIFMWFEDGISNEFGVKTGSCKINAAKQDLVLLGENSDILRHDQKCKNMKHSQDMQLIQKLRDDQKCMKKVFEVMSGRNIVTNSRVTPSWREIVSLTFSEAGVLHVNWISFGHCVLRRDDDAEKEELRAYLDIILGDDEVVNVESLATKYPIVDWKTRALLEDKMYYEIIRGDRSTKFYKIFIEMLDDFDRQDVLDLYRLVKERFETASPEGYDRLLWGDLITVFELSEDDDIWKAKQD